MVIKSQSLKTNGGMKVTFGKRRNGKHSKRFSKHATKYSKYRGQGKK